MTGVDTIGRERIEALIPHAGAMCLLDQLVRHDADHIECRSADPVPAEHPLQVDGSVPVEAGIEYAAQAMALHQSLCAASDGPPRQGFLAVLDDVQWTGERLDGQGADVLADGLRIEAELRQVSPAGSQYAFTVAAGERASVAGRALVVLGDPAS